MISDANKAVNDLASIVPLLGGSSSRKDFTCGRWQIDFKSRSRCLLTDSGTEQAKGASVPVWPRLERPRACVAGKTGPR